MLNKGHLLHRRPLLSRREEALFVEPFGLFPAPLWCHPVLAFVPSSHDHLKLMKQGCQGPSLALLSALSFLACWILGLPPCLLPHGSKRAAAVSDSSTVTEEPRGGQEAKALSSSDLKVSPLRRGEPLGGILTLTCRNWFTRQLGLRPVTGRRE